MNALNLFSSLLFGLMRAVKRGRIVIFHHSLSNFFFTIAIGMSHVDFFKFSARLQISASLYFISTRLDLKSNLTIINFQFSREYHCIIIYWWLLIRFSPIKKNNCLKIAIRKECKGEKNKSIWKQWRNIANKLYVCFKFVFEVSHFSSVSLIF